MCVSCEGGMCKLTQSVSKKTNVSVASKRTHKLKMGQGGH